MSCIERSIAIYHIAGAAIAGTPVPVPDPQVLGNVYTVMTVINDSDQDIKVTYRTVEGYDNAFIVPKSIKGFTKNLRNVMDNTSLMVWSMSNSSAAAGNITFNLAT